MCDKLSEMNTNHTLYREYYEKCYANIRESEILIDKNILYLSSGALAVTLGTITQLSTHNNKWFIISAWVCYIIAITCTLLSFFTSIGAHKKSIADAENLLIKNQQTHSAKKYDKITQLFSFSSFILFIIGIILTAIYYAMNLL
jgi:hypothetical protein